MNYQKNKKKIIRELLQSSDKDLTDEELIDEILSTNVTESSNKNEKASFGQKAADAVAKFAGSWAFIFSFVAVMAIWMIVNVLLAEVGVEYSAHLLRIDFELLTELRRVHIALSLEEILHTLLYLGHIEF